MDSEKEARLACMDAKIDVLMNIVKDVLAKLEEADKLKTVKTESRGGVGVEKLTQQRNLWRKLRRSSQRWRR